MPLDIVMPEELMSYDLAVFEPPSDQSPIKKEPVREKPTTLFLIAVISIIILKYAKNKKVPEK